jgi:hypothetical protein
MKSSSRTVIGHPADCIDLAQWLSTMTDREHQACSRSHRAAGTFREGEELLDQPAGVLRPICTLSPYATGAYPTVAICCSFNFLEQSTGHIA